MLMSVDASRCQSEFLRTFIRRHAHRAALPVKRAMTLTDDHIEQLRTLKGLYDEKIINSSEFAAKKAQILGTSIHHTGDNTPQDQDRSQDEDRSEVGSSSKPVKAKEGVNPDGAQRTLFPAGWTANVKIGGRSVGVVPASGSRGASASTTCAQCGRIFTWGAALKAHQKACKQKNKSSEQIVSAGRRRRLPDRPADLTRLSDHGRVRRRGKLGLGSKRWTPCTCWRNATLTRSRPEKKGKAVRWAYVGDFTRNAERVGGSSGYHLHSGL